MALCDCDVRSYTNSGLTRVLLKFWGNFESRRRRTAVEDVAGRMKPFRSEHWGEGQAPSIEGPEA